MYNVLIADKVDKLVLDQIQNSQITYDYQPEITPEKLIEIISNYEGLIVRSRTKVTKEIIETGQKLRVIGRVGTGLDSIDVEEAGKRKIKVINSPYSNSGAAAELTVALILSLIRKLPLAFSSMSQGLWLKKDLKGEEIEGKKVGIIGYGHIGKKVGVILTVFGASISYYSKSQQTDSLDNIFKDSDIITVHLPLNSETKNLINHDLLSQMKPTSYFINASRGGVVDEQALLKAVQENKIAGVALDVYWEEPLAPDSSWRKLDNVILTPHIGASTKEALKKGTEIVIGEVVQALTLGSVPVKVRHD